MQGINILHQEAVTEMPDWASILGAVSLICVCVFGTIAVIITNHSAVLNWPSVTCFCLSILSLILFVAVVSADPQVPTGRYRYECTIDRSVSIQYIYDNYKVVEQRGELWILEDKEEQ